MADLRQGRLDRSPPMSGTEKILYATAAHGVDGHHTEHARNSLVHVAFASMQAQGSTATAAS